jgi:hypothetical protein
MVMIGIYCMVDLEFTWIINYGNSQLFFFGLKFNQIFNGKIILDTIAKIKREQQEVLEFKEQSGKKGKSKKN